MENKIEMIKSLEQVINMLPDNLTEEESKKANKIMKTLEKLEKQVEKENSINM